jgi:hypothetical protein
MSEQQGQSEAQSDAQQGEQQSELDPQQRQQEPQVPVVGDVVPTSNLVPDAPETEQDLDRVGSLNAGGAFGHTPDHGDANASRLSGDPEAEGASDASEGE